MRAVAVFDLDGTITRTDTYLAFLLHTLRRRPQRAVHLASLSIAVTRFKLGRMSRDTLKSVFLTAIVGGCRRDEVDRLVEQFLPGCIRRTVKPAALARIAWHRARGHELILASASVDLYVGHVAEHFGFDRSVCTRTKWQNDRLTGRARRRQPAGRRQARRRARHGGGGRRPPRGLCLLGPPQ